jgi:hypothetical protein
MPIAFRHVETASEGPAAIGQLTVEEKEVRVRQRALVSPYHYIERGLMSSAQSKTTSGRLGESSSAVKGCGIHWSELQPASAFGVPP